MNPFAGSYNGGDHTIGNIKINKPSSDEQGLFGCISGTVENCYATGNISGTGTYIGGVVGLSSVNGSTVKNCYATGDVSGLDTTPTYVGGVAGANAVNPIVATRGTLQNCVALNPNIYAKSDVGRVVGYAPTPYHR